VTDLPKLALSVRQPWAWAIINAGKDIENRSWQAVNHGLRQRGRIAVHASKGMTRAEYEDACDTIKANGATCPPAHHLLRGGIIGSVEVVDVVTESDSPWFFGPRGLVLRSPIACEFIPARGQLGYFAWSEAHYSYAPEIEPWMRKEHRREVGRSPDDFVEIVKAQLRSRGVDGPGVASITVNKKTQATLNWLWQGRKCSLSLNKHFGRYMDGGDCLPGLSEAIDRAFFPNIQS
jgi:hypothetical protein